jgi:hypothetical protein
MARAAIVQRQLRFHPSHQSIGVGGGTALGPLGYFENVAAKEAGGEARPDCRFKDLTEVELRQRCALCPDAGRCDARSPGRD